MSSKAEEVHVKLEKRMAATFDAITMDLFKVENLQADIMEFQKAKVSKRELEKVRGDVMVGLKRKFMEGSMKIVTDIELDKTIVSVADPKRQTHGAFRPNFNPAHDCFAQLLPVYLEHIESLKKEKEELEREVKNLCLQAGLVKDELETKVEALHL